MSTASEFRAYAGAWIVAMSLFFSGIARAGAAQPDARGILTEARRAMLNVRALTYTAKWEGTGAVASTPMVQGKVKLVRTDTGLPLAGRIAAAAAEGAPPGKVLKFAYDGQRVQEWAEGDAAPAESAPGDLTALRSRKAMRLVPTGFLDVEPMDAPMERIAASYAGEAEIGGVKCDVLTLDVTPAEGAAAAGAARSRWAFGKDDHLPRRIERFVKVVTPGKPQAAESSDSAFVLTLTEMDLSPRLAAADFVLDGAGKADGPAVDRKPLPKLEPRRGLFAVSAPAPDFELNDAAAKPVRLSDFKGKVVLLAFWGTACEPCPGAMGDVQKLIDARAARGAVAPGDENEQPVVLGVTAKEPSGEPSKTMKERAYTFRALVDGQAVAAGYGVGPTLPVFYVVGRDGKVAYRAEGYKKGDADRLGRVIEAQLKK